MGLALVIGRINMAGGITAAVIGGTALIGGAYMSSQAAKSAANTQAGAADRATAAQGAALERQIELNKPFYDVGVTAANRLGAQAPFDPNAFNYQADPGYAFRLKEGMNQMNATAAARGGLISGNALRAGQAYGQQMGSQEYSNAYNRYLGAFNTNTANNQFLANLGQSSANQQANAVGNFGAAQAANLTGAANAQAAGQIGSANAYSSAIGQGIGAYQMNQLINRSAYNQPTNYYGGERAGGAAPVTDYSTLYQG
jgi:hypothetical protein